MTALLNIDSNAKTIKGQKQGFMTAILYLAPYDLAGVNVCPMAEIAGCIKGCLNTAGRAGIIKKGEETNQIQRARIARTRLWIEDRDAFMVQLVKELQAFIRKAGRAGLVPTVRLNGTSDLRWENQAVTVHGIEYRNLMEAFAGVQFYDYTKIPNRKRLPANYHLSWSYSEASERYAAFMPEALAKGMNPVVVFRTKDLPETFNGLPVVNGDESDLRFLDPQGVVVGLKAKGKARQDTSGFVVDA